MSTQQVLDWFAGGVPRYMTLDHCMNHDLVWIGLTVVLDLAVACGYLLIARHWWTNQRNLDGSPAKQALGNMRNIFVFCGLCGYLFIPIKMVWPAWRLYDLFLGVLAYYTWRYAWNARDLRVVYNELGRSRQLARDLEASRADANQKTFFLHAISHDLRTPLNGLTLQAQLAELQFEENDREGLRETLEEIRAVAKGAAEQLQQLLELGRLDWSQDTFHPSTFELSSVLDRVAASVRSEVNRKGLNLLLTGPTQLAVHTDRLKLERILQNLVHNAVKFTEDGIVRIDVQVIEARARIDVVDTGIGIAEKHLDQLFDEFYQVHNRERDRSKGFGLGLAIARKLALQMGADLVAESREGGGSCFSLILPSDALRASARTGLPDSPDGDRSQAASTAG